MRHLLTVRRLKVVVEVGMVGAIVVGLFLFTVMMSPLPVGDDPGYHSMVLRKLLETNSLHFTLPFFPSLHQVWGTERFVTPLILAFFGKIFGHVDVLAWPRYFAAGCMALSLIPVYLLLRRITTQPISSVIGVSFLATTKFYQENFWEGSYEQYSGLLLLLIILWLLYRLYETKMARYSIWALLCTALLFKTHQLGFLMALSTLGAVLIWYLYRQHANKLFWITIISGGVIALWLFPRLTQGFAINTVDYPIGKMLGEGEGVAIPAMILAIGGFWVAIRRRQWPVILFLAISVVFSQSYYLGVPFYAYRFNLYFMVAVAACIALGFEGLRSWLRPKIFLQPMFELFSALLFFWMIVYPQIHYSYGLWDWVSSQERNPASVILYADIEAMHWAERNTNPRDVFIAPLKWGYYIPALAGRQVILTDAVGGDARDARYPLAQLANSVFLQSDSKIAAEKMKTLGARYIFFSSSIGRFPERFPGYHLTQFQNPKYFSIAYEAKGVIIYELR